MDPGKDGVDPGTPLTDNATSQAWKLISSDFPIGFAIYSQAVLNQYTGTLLSLNSGELFVAIESFGVLSSLQMLTVSLPGRIPLRAAIPNLSAGLQTIGVSVQSKLLMVVVNCDIINAVWLANVPHSFNISTVEVFNPSTSVRLECMIKCVNSVDYMLCISVGEVRALLK